MLVEDCYTDNAKRLQAEARMEQIAAEMESALPERRAELEAEQKALDGSWVTRRWIEVPGVITEAEAIEHDKAEKARADARAAEKAALRAKVSALAKEPPRPQDLAQALSDLAKAVEALT